MQQDYFFVLSQTGERESADAPLAVNCAGLTDTTAAFQVSRPCGRTDYTLYYLHEGELSISFGETPLSNVEAGAVIVIPSNTPTFYSYSGNMPIKIYWAHFTGNSVEKLLSDCSFSPSGCIRRFSASSEAAHIFQAFLDEMKNPPTESTVLRAAAALVMTLTGLEHIAAEGNRNRRLICSFAYLQEHFTENIPKRSLAEMEGLSVSQYELLFRRTTGRTPTQYVTKLRMSLAKKLLSETAMPVGEIAEACGYDDAFYFSRVFSQEEGMSPRSYRKGT